MSQLITPIDYKSLLDMKQTEQGIKLIKEFFQQNISTELRLRRVTAPLFVLQGLGRTMKTEMNEALTKLNEAEKRKRQKH